MPKPAIPLSWLAKKIFEILVDEVVDRQLRAFLKSRRTQRDFRKALEQTIKSFQQTHPQWAAVLFPLVDPWNQKMAQLLSRVLNPAEPDPDPSELADLWRQALVRMKPSPSFPSPPLDLVAKDFLEAFQKALYDQPVLQEILKQRTYRHLDEHLETLTHVLGKGPARPITRQAYLHWVISQHAHVDTRGTAEMTSPPVRLPLDRIFVPLRVSPGMSLQSDRPLNEALRRLEEKLRRRGLGEGEIRLQIEAYLARHNDLLAEDLRQETGLPVLRVLRQHARIVLLGEPGIGKTTLLRYLALQHARALMDGRKMAGPQGQLGPTRFPIYLRIADYIQTPEWPTQPVSEILPLILRRYELTVAGLADLLHEKMERGEALILLDGLDEIPSVDERIRVVQRIDNFVQQYVRRGNRFVITSRIVGYRQAPLSHEYAHFVLREMNDDQMRTFVRRWVHAYEDATAPDDPPEARKARAEAEAQRLLQAIARNPGVRRLASNPFMLQILALIHRSQALLPQRRVHLYKIAARTLIEHWNVVRGLPPEARLNPQQVERVLAHLAFWLHQERPGGLAARQEVHQRITQALQQEGEGNGTGAAAFHLRNLAEDFLRRVREQTGLFVERAPGYFGFDHLAFEEYFAARYLVRLLLDTRSTQREKGLRFLRTHLHDPNWREPILLALGYIDQEGLLPVDDLVRTAILAQGEEAQRLGFRPSPYEDLLGQDYLFALQCMADDIHLPALRKPLLGQLIQEWVYHKGRGRFRAYRAALARRLVAMQGTAVGMELTRTFAHLARNNTHAQARQAALEGLEHLRATHLLRERRKPPQQSAEATPTEILLLAGTAEGVTALVQALESATDPLARKALIQILGESGSRQALPHLIQALLRDHDWRVRTAAAWALGRIGTPLAVSPLVQVLKRDADERVQTMALWALGRIGSLRGMNALVDALQHASPRIRRAAAVALGTMAVPQALTFLARALEGDEDPRVREAAAESLGHIDSREALDVLRRALEDPEPGVRRAAAWALGRIGASSAAEPLLRLLESDGDWRVRATAAWALGRIGERTATAALVRHLLSKKETVAVREAAAESLGRLGVATGELIHVLHEDKDWRVRRAAALALGYHPKARRALPALIQTLLKDKSMAVRRTATEAISRLILYLKDETPRDVLAQTIATHLREQIQTPRADDLHAALWVLMVRE